MNDQQTQTAQRVARSSPPHGSATWWRTSKFGWHTEKVEVEKETDSFVVVKGYMGGRSRRESKHSSYADYWPTAKDALEYLRKRAIDRKASLERDLSEISKVLADMSPNAGTQRPGTPDGSLATETRKPGSLKRMVRPLRLHLKGCYWDAIRDGTKTHEYRLAEKWEKRLAGKTYDEIHLLRGYPKRNDESRLLRRAWRGYEIKWLCHPHFGSGEVRVLAIEVTARPNAKLTP